MINKTAHRILKLVCFIAFSCACGPSARSDVPMYLPYWAAVYLDGVPILQSDEIVMHSQPKKEEVAKALGECKFNVLYPFDGQRFKSKDQEEYSLKGDVFIEVAGFGSRLDSLTLDDELRIVESPRGSVLNRMHGLDAKNESPSKKYRALDYKSRPFDGSYELYVFSGGELVLKGWRHFIRHAKVTEPVFEKELLKIEVSPVQNSSLIPQGDPPKAIQLEGDILIMSFGVICFVDKLHLELVKKDKYLISEESRKTAFTEYKRQNLTLDHQLDFLMLEPFPRPASVLEKDK